MISNGSFLCISEMTAERTGRRTQTGFLTGCGFDHGAYFTECMTVVKTNRERNAGPGGEGAEDAEVHRFSSGDLNGENLLVIADLLNFINGFCTLEALNVNK